MRKLSKVKYDAIDDCISLLERTANCHFSVFDKDEDDMKYWNILLSLRDKLKKELDKVERVD